MSAAPGAHPDGETVIRAVADCAASRDLFRSLVESVAQAAVPDERGGATIQLSPPLWGAIRHALQDQPQPSVTTERQGD